MQIKIPQPVDRALAMLEDAGFEAYIVGGCVRDAVLGTSPDDYDITTSALPEETASVFAGERVIATGLKHGTQTVLIDGMPLEITTFRVESGYSDSRHPDEVSFTRSLREDVLRRDFTMNAIACDRRGRLHDHCGGESDIRDGIIRCVGDAEKRFAEDALRIMRAVRFSSVLGFRIEEKTLAAAFALRERLSLVSAERIYTELIKLLCGSDVRRVLVDYVDILGVVIPELIRMKGFEQHNKHHIYNVLEHTAVAVESIRPEPVLRLAALLHDAGKPDCFSLDENGVGHFYGHAAVSSEVAKSLLHRLKADGETQRLVTELVNRHDLTITPDSRSVRRRLNQLGPEKLLLLLELMRADTLAQSPQHHDRLDEYDAIEREVRAQLDAGLCFSLRDMAVNGNDLLGLGLAEGEEIGRILSSLLDAVISGEKANEREELLEFARTLTAKT